MPSEYPLTTLRNALVTLIRSIDGAPTYWYDLTASRVRYGRPMAEADDIRYGGVLVYIDVLDWNADEAMPVMGVPDAQVHQPQFEVIGLVRDEDPITARERLLQDLLTAIHNDPGIGDTAHFFREVSGTFRASEFDRKLDLTTEGVCRTFFRGEISTT